NMENLGKSVRCSISSLRLIEKGKVMDTDQRSEKERYRRAKEIFEKALELDESKREAYLEESCSGDELLKEEVQMMLEVDKRADSTWDKAIDSQIAEKIGEIYRQDQTASLIRQKLNNRY